MEFRELKADEIDVRVQRVGQNNNGYYAIFLLYKDARCDMTILDETVGCLNGKESMKSLTTIYFVLCLFLMMPAVNGSVSKMLG